MILSLMRLSNRLVVELINQICPEEPSILARCSNSQLTDLFKRCMRGPELYQFIQQADMQLPRERTRAVVAPALSDLLAADFQRLFPVVDPKMLVASMNQKSHLKAMLGCEASSELWLALFHAGIKNDCNDPQWINAVITKIVPTLLPPSAPWSERHALHQHLTALAGLLAQLTAERLAFVAMAIQPLLRRYLLDLTCIWYNSHIEKVGQRLAKIHEVRMALPLKEQGVVRGWEFRLQVQTRLARARELAEHYESRKYHLTPHLPQIFAGIIDRDGTHLVVARVNHLRKVVHWLRRLCYPVKFTPLVNATLVKQLETIHLDKRFQEQTIASVKWYCRLASEVPDSATVREILRRDDVIAHRQR